MNKTRLGWRQFSLRTFMFGVFALGLLACLAGPQVYKSIGEWVTGVIYVEDQQPNLSPEELRDILDKWERAWNGEDSQLKPTRVDGGVI